MNKKKEKTERQLAFGKKKGHFDDTNSFKLFCHQYFATMPIRLLEFKFYFVFSKLSAVNPIFNMNLSDRL